MKESIADSIMDQGIDLELHDDYSGRGMFGKRTCAVSGDRDELVKAITKAGFDYDEFRWDDFGLGSIAY